jgi:hypothetical protein
MKSPRPLLPSVFTTDAEFDEHLAVEPAVIGWIHVWRREGGGTNDGVWLEDDDTIRPVAIPELKRLLWSIEHDGWAAATLVLR